jgi:hypothetical protein
LVSSAACGGDGDVGEGDGALTGASLEPFTDQDFTTDISKEFIQGTHSLSKEAFETKWKASRSDSPLMFFRAYPAAYHKDFAANLKPGARAKIPSARGLCLGDAHPDNFGFLKFDQKVEYSFNDLDDSGNCPLGLDALRFVTAVRLYFDGDLAKTAAKRYVSVLRGDTTEADARHDIIKVRDDNQPDFAERRTDKLGDLVKQDTIKVDDGMSSISEPTRKAVFDAATRVFPTITPLDAVEIQRDAGGSGGLTRYWLLIRRGSARGLLELKEAATPGVDFGIDPKPIKRDGRLQELKHDIWDVTTDKDYVYSDALGKTFLVRDRLAKASIDLPKMKRKDLEDVIQAQASILALIHKGAMKVGSDDAASALKHWLEDGSDVMASRWKHAFK